jgi:large subunit ribosomal protein L19
MRKDLPDFRIGDTVNISVKIVEGDKERVQTFSGVVIARRGSGLGESFVVRRIVNNEGVERTFPLHSPKIVGIEIVRGGDVRRAKLYFLRSRLGKASRLKDTLRKGDQAREPARVPAAAEADQASSS